MLLTADIGNTNIVLALLDEKDRVVSQCRVPSGETLPPEAYDDAIRRVLEGRTAPEGAVIGSVVPRLTAETAAAIRRVTGLEALMVGPTTPAGLDIAIEQPETLGVDLLAADAAAAAEYPLPVVVFDFGTATTVTVVDADRRYRGGVILAGGEAESPRPVFRHGPAAGYRPGGPGEGHLLRHRGQPSGWGHLRGRRHGRRSAGPHGGGAGRNPAPPWPPAAWPGSSPPIAAGTSAGTTACFCGAWP
ncbi:MAG: type III pantothenate kinase [Oscillospiraceae bacterium]